MRSASTPSPRRDAAGALALLLHLALEALEVDPEPGLARELGGQLDGETVRVVELEDIAGVQVGGAGLAGAGDQVVEQPGAGREGLREAILLGLEQAAHVVAMLRQSGEATAHRLDHGLVDGCEERRLEPQPRAMQDGAPQDPAQDVAAPFVGRRHAVGGDRRHAARVIAEHPERAHRVAAIGIAAAGEALHGLDHVGGLVGLEEAPRALQEHRHALHPAAGVDVLRGQRRERAVVAAIELHEDEVPELQEAIAVAARPALGPAAAEAQSAVVVELRARTTRPRGPRLPEVVLAERHDPARRDALLDPEIPRDVVGAHLAIALVDRRPEVLGIQPERAGRELVRHFHRARLEVVAEREVAHHLEVGEVAIGGAHDVDVDGAEAALHGREPRSRRHRLAEEVGLERLHARGRQQNRLVERRGHERRRRHGKMPALDEELREAAADLVGRRHRAHSSPILCVTRHSTAPAENCPNPLSCPRRPVPMAKV
jgi:hypothetical protein